MKYTQAKDDAYDRKHGIKENTRKDSKIDMARGLKGSMKASTTTKTPKAATHSSKVVPAQKAKMSHPAGKPGNRMTAQMKASSTVKAPVKAANRKSLFERIKNKPLFKD